MRVGLFLACCRMPCPWLNMAALGEARPFHGSGTLIRPPYTVVGLQVSRVLVILMGTLCVTAARQESIDVGISAFFGCVPYPTLPCLAVCSWCAWLGVVSLPAAPSRKDEDLFATAAAHSKISRFVGRVPSDLRSTRGRRRALPGRRARQGLRS